MNSTGKKNRVLKIPKHFHLFVLTRLCNVTVFSYTYNTINEAKVSTGKKQYPHQNKLVVNDDFAGDFLLTRC